MTLQDCGNDSESLQTNFYTLVLTYTSLSIRLKLELSSSMELIGVQMH